MRVDVKLFASLREKLPPSSGRPAGKGTVNLPDAATLGDLIHQLDISPDLAQMVLVNGEQIREFGRALTDGDQVSIFPPVAGGSAVEIISPCTSEKVREHCFTEPVLMARKRRTSA